VENIAGYVYDHTTCNARRWHQLTADQQGPYFVSMLHGPRRDEFLRSGRSHTEKNSCCDPLDGRVHGLKDVTCWIGIRELALRFIGLGVILGVFELVQPWMRREQESHEDMINRLERENEARFRLKLGQVASIFSIGTGVVSQSGGVKKCTPDIVAFSSERPSATLPRSSSMASRRDRSISRNARQLTFPDSWSTGRSDRPRGG
jgi:hypothetical protein